jgi:2',3'-cyclic-nucleotide 2'-phosphodiesterase (5'-nucleotidase family)
MTLTIFHTNDLHGKLDEAKVDRILALKEEASKHGPILYLDSGDCIKAGNLAIPLKPDPAWPLLERADCEAGVLGNRETHVLESAFHAKLQGAKHPLLCTNLRRKDGSRPLPRSMVLRKGELRVGLLGVMVPMVTERMATKAASAYLWDDPIQEALAIESELGDRCDLLIALTHIGHKNDLQLAERSKHIHMILGGHSHTQLDEPVQIGDRWVCQGGAHGRFIGRYIWEAGKGLVDGRLLPIDG